MKKIAMFSWFVIPFDGFPSRKNYKILNCPHPKSRAPTLTGLEIARRNLSRLRDRSHRWLMVIRDQISSLVTGHFFNVFRLDPVVFPSAREKPYRNLPDQDICSDPPSRAGVSSSSLSRSDRPFQLFCVARVIASGGMPGAPCQIRGRGA